MWPLQKNPWGLFGPFTPLPINPSAHSTWSHCTHNIASHSIFCTIILHNIIKWGYYGRNIPDIRTRCHQIPNMFQFINQYQVKSKEIDISIPPTSTQFQIPGAWVWWAPMCLTHRWGQYVLPLNRNGHIYLYLLLPSPGYFQNMPRTSFT